VGALVFGQLTDRFGRKRLFMVTLGIYLTGTVLTALTFSPGWFFACRFLTGMGIGGEYSAINSAIDELIPARRRGRVDISINGSYWLGGIGGSLLAVFLLNTAIFPINVGWRLSFVLGAVIGLAVLLVRRNVPESPRWLFIHGREKEAEKIVTEIEEQVSEQAGERLPEPEGEPLTVRQRRTIPLPLIVRSVVSLYPRRTILGLSLFIGQAFLYNSILFGFGNLLSLYFHTPSGNVPYYLAVFAVGNFAGALLLSPLFDTVGRKPMIAGTYILSGALLIVTGFLFKAHELNDISFTACCCVVFFFASAGASAAYLTVSEVFPLDPRVVHRGVLRGGHRDRRGDRPAGVQPHDQHRKLRAGVPRAQSRRGDDDPRRRGRATVRRESRGRKPREHRQAADSRGLPEGVRRPRTGRLVEASGSPADYREG
jgi:MFS family permease